MGSRRMNEPGWCQARCGEVRSGGFWEDPDGAQLGSGKTQTELSLAAVRRFPASSEVAAGAGRQLPHAATPTLRPCSKCPCCGKSTDGAHVAAGIPRESPVPIGGKEKGGWGGDWAGVGPPHSPAVGSAPTPGGAGTRTGTQRCRPWAGPGPQPWALPMPLGWPAAQRPDAGTKAVREEPPEACGASPQVPGL